MREPDSCKHKFIYVYAFYDSRSGKHKIRGIRRCTLIDGVATYDCERNCPNYVERPKNQEIQVRMSLSTFRILRSAGSGDAGKNRKARPVRMVYVEGVHSRREELIKRLEEMRREGLLVDYAISFASLRDESSHPNFSLQTRSCSGRVGRGR